MHDEDEPGKEGGAETIPVQSVLGAGRDAAKAKKNRLKTQSLKIPQHILDKQQEEHKAKLAAQPMNIGRTAEPELVCAKGGTAAEAMESCPNGALRCSIS